MTVNIRSLSPLTLRTPFNYWEDDFGVSGQTISQVNNNYLHHGITTEVEAIGVNNGFLITGTAVGVSRVCFRVPMQVVGVLNQNQFAEAIIESFAGAGRCGVAVMCAANNRDIEPVAAGINHGYLLATRPEAAIMDLQTVTNGTIANLTAGVCPLAAGDVMAITATINPANVTLQVWRNGVLQNTTVDAGVGRFTNGLPAFFGRQNSVVSVELGHFRAGTLNRF